MNTATEVQHERTGNSSILKYQTSTQIQFVVRYPRPSYVPYWIMFGVLTLLFYK
ncbi:hypothetical protein HMI56_002625, partial [Coelomomyces lativittatus]